MSKNNTLLQRLMIPSLIISIIAGVLLWSQYQLTSAAQPMNDRVVISGRLYPQAEPVTLSTPTVTTAKTITPSTPATVITTPTAKPSQVNVLAPNAINVKLVIQQPNKKSQWSFQVLENSTVDATMRWASAQYHFSYVTKQFSGLGTFVDEINGVSSNAKSGMYWLYYVNGVPAATGVSSYILHDGDTITWKYRSG